MPVSYVFKPQEDITAYELAQALNVILAQGGWTSNAFFYGIVITHDTLVAQLEELPATVLRHFEKRGGG